MRSIGFRRSIRTATLAIQSSQMNSKRTISTLQKRIQENNLLEDYLQSLHEKHLEQEKKIAALDAKLNRSFKQYQIFDSTLFQTVYGKYAEERVSKVEKIKDEYYKTALALKDYERIHEILATQKELVISKLEKNEALINNLLELLSNEELMQNVGAFQCEAFVEDQIIYYSQQIAIQLQYVEEITKHLQTCEQITEDLQQFNAFLDDKILQYKMEESALIQTSILHKMADLPRRVQDTDTKLTEFIKSLTPKLKMWQNRHKHIGDTSEHFRLLRHKTQGGRGAIESLIIEGEERQLDGTSTHYQLREVSWIISKLMGEIRYIKHVMLSEIEMVQKDVIDFRNLQLDLIKEQF